VNWLPGFANPMGAWLFAAMIPVIVFYFLKLRRARLELSSLALWRQVISDQRVNAPFQKFKRNLLLLLQLLLVCLLALALTQPFMMGANSRDQKIIILVDCSASMGAVDAAGKSRLDLAKEEVGRIIDSLLPGQQLCLFEITNAGRNLAFTDNKVVLRRELASLTVTDVPTRLETGLNLVQGLTLDNEKRAVLFFTDGNLPTRPDPITGKAVAAVDLQLPFQVNFHLIPKAGPNLGITALNARRAGRDKWEVFVRVDSSAEKGAEAKLQLLVNGQQEVEDKLIFTSQESQKLAFKVDASAASSLEVRLVPEGQDSLKSDNVALMDLPAIRDLNVYCPTSLPAWRHAIEGLEGIVVDPPASGPSKSAVHELVITDTLTDLVRDTPMCVVVGQIPKDLTERIKIVDGEAEVVDWQRNADLLQHVRLKEVRISGVPTLAKDVKDEAIEELGYRILAFGSGGPLIVEKSSGAKLQYFLLFHTDRSTLPYRLAFPIFVNNCINLALRQSELSEVQAAATGAIPPMSLDPDSTYRITSPDGRHQDVMTDKEGTLHAIGAPVVGPYEIRKDGKVVKTIGASLLNSTESMLGQVEEIRFDDSSAVATTEAPREAKSFWPTLATLAFVLLLAEWWLYQKRPAGAPA
jgi:Ca-activated chloride channel family protein